VANNTVTFDHELERVPVDTLQAEVIEGDDAGRSVTADSERLAVGTAQGNDLVLRDPTVSRYHVELERTPEGVLVVDQGSTNGVYCGAVRVERAVVPAGTTLKLGRCSLRIGAGEPAQVELYGRDRLGDLRGQGESMRRLMRQIERVAKTETSTLIVGESGTGKELIAQLLHDLGPRMSKPFVVVDCGAMSPNLVASELFGHERGAFTSADRQHIGAFERASGGTIFLDEIGELPNELQPTLLGALERRRFRRVGGREEIGVDVRVVAATNRDLRAEVNDGRFRLDLYYRLAVVTLRIPPLRERPEDLELLVKHFLSELGHSGDIHELIPADVLAQLRAHHWPGNVRELKNLVEATVAMGEAPVDMMQDVKAPDGDGIPVRPVYPLPYKDARAAVLHEFERRYLGHWLERSGGNVAKAARQARMDRSHLFHLLRRHDLR